MTQTHIWTVLGKSPLYRDPIAFGRFRTAAEAYKFADSLESDNTSVAFLRVAKVNTQDVFMPQA